MAIGTSRCGASTVWQTEIIKRKAWRGEYAEARQQERRPFIRGQVRVKSHKWRRECQSIPVERKGVFNFLRSEATV
jgi:hypothetical protein